MQCTEIKLFKFFILYFSNKRAKKKTKMRNIEQKRNSNSCSIIFFFYSFQCYLTHRKNSLEYEKIGSKVEISDSMHVLHFPNTERKKEIDILK